MKQLIILGLFISLSFLSLAQKGDFHGRIINPFNDYEHNYRITAVSLTDSTTYEWLADSLGYFQDTNVYYGTYQFFISHKMNDGKIMDSIRIDSSISNWETTIPNCSTVNENGICDICNNPNFVIKLDPYSFQDMWFKTTKDEKNYYKNQKKIGYSIQDNKLIWIYDKKQKEKFIDPCNHWFCKKHLVIF
jgi:hypothetical protein